MSGPSLAPGQSVALDWHRDVEQPGTVYAVDPITLDRYVAVSRPGRPLGATYRVETSGGSVKTLDPSMVTVTAAQERAQRVADDHRARVYREMTGR